jgi:CPA1 family monovalent cation:H+ antiporter
MPLPVGFALAAALSPTDAVAVSAIAERCTFPRRILAVLKGEALLNDASGLVCLRFAIVASLAGSFSLTQAAANFTELVLGGVAVGFGTTWFIVVTKNVFASWFGEDVTNQILISLLIPFVVYIAADYVHVSGILAVVSAGLTMNYFELQGRALALTRVRREVVWGMIHSVLNGAIFVLMGEQLVPVFRGAMRETEAIGYTSPLWLVFWTILIGTALWLLRFLWVFISLRVTSFRGVQPTSQDAIENWRSIAAGTFGGVRGAMTFAAILTLPISLPDGSAFPFRDVSICLAAGVIMMTLLTAALILPNILGHVGVAIDDTSDLQEISARAVAAAAGIRAIEHTKIALIASGANDAAAERAAAPYRRRVTGHVQGGLGRRNRKVDEKIALELESAALQAEREVIFQLQAAHAIDQDTQRRLLREIDIAEIVMRDQRVRN